MQTQLQTKIDTIKNLDKKGLFSFVAVTEKEALQKSRVKTLLSDGTTFQQPTPEAYKHIKKLIWQTVSLGHKYQDLVNNQRGREGKEKDFVAAETYVEPASDNMILFKHKTKDQYYVRVYPNICFNFHKPVVKYFMEDKEITKERYEEIELDFLKLSGGKNENQGLDDPRQCYNYKIENIMWLKQGEFKFSELSTQIMEMIRG